MKTINVDNCQECPLVLFDDEYGYNGCSLKEIRLLTREELPGNKVHDKCPLKQNDYTIRLK